MSSIILFMSPMMSPINLMLAPIMAPMSPINMRLAPIVAPMERYPERFGTFSGTIRKYTHEASDAKVDVV